MNIGAIPIYVTLMIIFSGLSSNMDRHGFGVLKSGNSYLAGALIPFSLISSYFVAGPILIWALIQTKSLSIIFGLVIGIACLFLLGFLLNKFYSWITNPEGTDRLLIGHLIDFSLNIASSIAVLLIAYILYSAL
jgi:hypothetical protein